MGDLELMRPGIIDMLGVFFLKVPITKVLFFSGEKQGAGLKRHIISSYWPYSSLQLQTFMSFSCNLSRLLLMSLSLRVQTRDLKLTGKIHTASHYSLRMRGKEVRPFNLFRYSLEYASPDKSAFHALFSDKAKKANITDPGVCHGDELM